MTVGVSAQFANPNSGAAIANPTCAKLCLSTEENSMRSVKFTSWKDGDFYIGFLNEYPDYRTQALSREELAENLKDLLADLESEQVPYIQKVDELLVA
jgi:hypothetical protein